MLELAKTFLEKEDERLKIDVASSAEKGLKKLGEEGYDAIVSDYQMPVMDGLEFLEIVREDKGYDIPFIIFTGKGREEVAIDALNLGADLYLQKGGDPKTQFGVLASAIINQVNRYNAEKRQEEVLREFEDLFNNLNDAVFVHDLEGNFLAVNDTAVNRLGYSEEELLSMKPNDIDESDYSEEVGERISEIRKWKDLVFESVHVTKGNERIPVEISSTLITYRGEPAVLSVARDITERKEANRRFKKLYETTPDPVFLLDSNGRVKIANEAFYEVTGYEQSEIVGKNLSEVEFLSDSAQNSISNVFSNGSIFPERVPENLEFITREGELRFMELFCSTLGGNDEGGWCVIICKDVTDKRRIKEKLQDSVGVYRGLLENSPDAIVLTDLGTKKVVDANKEAEELFGKSREKIVGMHQAEFHSEGEFERYQEVFQADGIEEIEGDNFERMGLYVLNDSGRKIPVILSGTFLEVKGRETVYCVFKDISKLVGDGLEELSVPKVTEEGF